jgi:aarF domain-containing kinase
MASLGWIRVARGLQKVLNVAVHHIVDHGQEKTFRLMQHGLDLGGTTANKIIMTSRRSNNHDDDTTTTTTTTTTFMAGSKEEISLSIQNHNRNMSFTKIQSTDNNNFQQSWDKNTIQNLSNNDDNENNINHMNVPSTHVSNEPTLPSTTIQDPVSESNFQSRTHIREDSESHNSIIHDIEHSPMMMERQEPNDITNSSFNDTHLPEGPQVPATRVSRALGFASLGLGLVWGTAAELTSQILMGSNQRSNNNNDNSNSSTLQQLIVNNDNSDRLAATLCRMRGAALKMGQMLSIQDESLLPPALTRALQKVRQGAEAMPQRQLEQQLRKELGDNWRDQFESFEDMPFAAASIGQVHRATIRTNDKDPMSIKQVVVKVQYPGVAQSIESDLQNLTMLVKMTGFAPKGLFLDNVIRVGREELKVECNYLLEKENQRRFKTLVENDPFLRREKVFVPDVMEGLTTNQIITSELARGGTIDKVVNLHQTERNRIGRLIFYLTIQELFVWRFMQTDPNWGNFLYDMGTQTTTLLDFGAAREYPKQFVDGYLRIVWANANRDEETLMTLSHQMGFLTGTEPPIMMDAHKWSGFTLGEPFASKEPFDFRGSNISSRLSAHSSVFLQHRQTPPPEEVYTLHRKLAGAFMLCIKLGAKVQCRDLLINVLQNHTFTDGMDPPQIHG